MTSLVLVPVTDGNSICPAIFPAFVIFARIRGQLVSLLGAWFLIGGMLSFAPGVNRVQNLVTWGGPVFFHLRFVGIVTLLCLLIWLGVQNKSAPVGGSILDRRRA
jgi:hypothetical protein